MKCIDNDKLILFLSGVIKQLGNEEQNHILHCHKCKEKIVIGSEYLKTFTPEKNIMDNILNQVNNPKPKTNIGQIWSMRILPVFENLVVISVPLLTIPNNTEKFLKVVPLSIYTQNTLCSSDEPMIEPSENIFNQRFIMECWNERPINRNFLSIYFGNLPQRFNPIMLEVLNKISNHEIILNLNDDLNKYRAKRILKSTNLSRTMFQHNPEYEVFN